MNVVSYRPKKPLIPFLGIVTISILDMKRDGSRFQSLMIAVTILCFSKKPMVLFIPGPVMIQSPLKAKRLLYIIEPRHREIEAANSLTFFTIKLQPWANAHFFSTLKEGPVWSIWGASILG